MVRNPQTSAPSPGTFVLPLRVSSFDPPSSPLASTPSRFGRVGEATKRKGMVEARDTTPTSQNTASG